MASPHQAVPPAYLKVTLCASGWRRSLEIQPCHSLNWRVVPGDTGGHGFQGKRAMSVRNHFQPTRAFITCSLNRFYKSLDVGGPI